MARRVNSKAKGNRFERVVCKSFQNWSGYEFSRTPSSGGLRWKKADNISSDVICSDPKHSKKFPFSIEVKTIKRLSSNISYSDSRVAKSYPFGNKPQKMLNVLERYPYLS